MSQKNFAQRKAKQLLESEKIDFPENDLYGFAKQNPEFIDGKVTRFKSFWTKKMIEIQWSNQVLGDENYLCLGHYEGSYISLAVNRENEVWLVYDVSNEGVFWANNMKEAVAKLIIEKEFDFDKFEFVP